MGTVRVIRRGFLRLVLAGVFLLAAFTVHTQTPASAQAAAQTWSIDNLSATGLGQSFPIMGQTATAISCPSPGFCVVVGDYTGSEGYVPAANSYGVFADTLVDGTWSLEILPMPSDAFQAQLSALSCVSETMCVAVGRYQQGLVPTQGLLIETMSGTTWTASTIPEVAGGGSALFGLNSVSCSSLTTCVAVGSDGVEQIIETLNGSTWTQSVPPLPPSPFGTDTGDLFSVGCPSPTSCVAMGTYRTGPHGNFYVMAATLSDSSWSVAALPLPPGDQSPEQQPLPISCVASGSCLVVAQVFHGSGRVRTIAETLAGTTSAWAKIAIPRDTILDGVSCSAPSACVAVGSASPDGSAIGYTLSGTTWTPTTFSTVLGAVQAALAVACDARSSCFAIGNVYGSPNQSIPLAFDLASTAWTATALPVPGPTPAALLSSVTCSTSQSCLAVGTTFDTVGSFTPGTPLPFVDSLSGGTWTTTLPSLPPDAIGVPSLLVGSQPLQSISCPSANFCVAVGSYTPAPARTKPLAEIFSGGSWQPVALPVPARFPPKTFVVMTSVSCVSNASCVAVGGIDQLGGILIETLANGVWRPTVVPATKMASLKYPGAISCFTSTSCLVVGVYGANSSQQWPVALTVSGRRWTTVKLPLPDNAATIGAFGLNSIWCQSSVACVATGYYDGVVSGTLEPFAETLSHGKWSAAAMPSPPAPDQETLLNGVSCTLVTSCVAVGSFDGTPLVETLSGTTWSASVLAMPPADTNVLLQSVACPSSVSCVAVGMGTGPGGMYPLVARYGS
jgi:hypothetical protein